MFTCTGEHPTAQELFDCDSCATLLDHLTETPATTLEAAMYHVVQEWLAQDETNVRAEPIGYGKFVVHSDHMAGMYEWTL